MSLFALTFAAVGAAGVTAPQPVNFSSRMSAPYQLNSAGSVVPWQTSAGSTMTTMVTHRTVTIVANPFSGSNR